MSAHAPAYSAKEKENKKKPEDILDRNITDYTVKSVTSYFLSKDFKNLYGQKLKKDEITSALYDRLLKQLNESYSAAVVNMGYPPLTREYVSRMLMSKKSGETVGDYVGGTMDTQYGKLEKQRKERAGMTDEMKTRADQAKNAEQSAQARREKRRNRANPKKRSGLV
jgi:hypothetical protein